MENFIFSSCIAFRKGKTMITWVSLKRGSHIKKKIGRKRLGWSNLVEKFECMVKNKTPFAPYSVINKRQPIPTDNLLCKLCCEPTFWKVYVAPTGGSLTLLAPEVLACYMSLDITKLENVISQMSHILMTDVFTFTQKRDRSELEGIKVADI